MGMASRVMYQKCQPFVECMVCHFCCVAAVPCQTLPARGPLRRGRFDMPQPVQNLSFNAEPAGDGAVRTKESSTDQRKKRSPAGSALNEVSVVISLDLAWQHWDTSARIASR